MAAHALEACATGWPALAFAGRKLSFASSLEHCTMQPDLKPGTPRPLMYLLAVGAGITIAALSWGFVLDARPMLDQPDLFWPFLFFGLCGSLLGWRIAMRHDNHPLRNLVGLVGSLVAWRVSYFPFMVVAGWKASLGEWVTFNTLGV